MGTGGPVPIDPDHCATCYALAHSTVEVSATRRDDDTLVLVPNVPVPLEDDPTELATSAEARAHPLGRALWTSGVAGLRLTATQVEIRKIPAMPWDFLEPQVARILVERLTLAHGDAHT